MATILLLAPAPLLRFTATPSNTVYSADSNGLVYVTNGSMADVAALAAAGCALLPPLSIGITETTLAALYAADVAVPFAQGTYAIVFADSTAGNNGLWQKTGTGNGVGNWTQIASYTVAALQAQANANTAAIAAETARAEGVEGPIAGNVATLQGQMSTANANIATNTNAIANEITRAEAAETVNASRITVETGRAETAETTLGTFVSTLQAQVTAGRFNTGQYCLGGTPPGTVDAATTGALPAFTYDDEPGGDRLIELGTAALASQDGVAMSVGKRVLVKNQTGSGANGAFTNGIYVLTQQGDGSTVPWILTRAPDAYLAAQLGGIECLVNGGTANGGTVWVLPIASAGITVGTTQLIFAQVANGLGAVTSQAGSSYTLQPGDNNSIIIFTSSSAVTVTAPATLPVGFSCKLEQGGTAQVSLAAGAGATVNTPNQAMTTGRYGIIDCRVTANPGGTAAVWNAIATAPPNVGATLVAETANYSATGAEGFIEANAAGGAFAITVAPSVVNGREPIRVRKIDATANAVTISDGVNICFALITPANALGNGGGWCDVSSNGANLRTEGTP